VYVYKFTALHNGDFHDNRTKYQCSIPSTKAIGETQRQRMTVSEKRRARETPNEPNDGDRVQQTNSSTKRQASLLTSTLIDQTLD
jgi:hypothetical protein